MFFTAYTMSQWWWFCSTCWLLWSTVHIKKLRWVLFSSCSLLLCCKKDRINRNYFSGMQKVWRDYHRKRYHKMYKRGLTLSNNSAKLQNLTGSKQVYLMLCTHYTWHPTTVKNQIRKCIVLKILRFQKEISGCWNESKSVFIVPAFQAMSSKSTAFTQMQAHAHTNRKNDYLRRGVQMDMSFPVFSVSSGKC